jgi:hypothetical protein
MFVVLPSRPIPRWLAMLALALLVVTGCRRVEAPAEGDACATVADCAPTPRLSCRNGTCQEIRCRRSNECPSGAACIDRYCAAAECNVDGDCTDDARCFEGDCRSDLCRSVDDCGPGATCRGVPPRCQPPPSVCEEDGQCPADQGCKLPQAVCDALCARDADCESSEYCDGEFCRARCEQTADCLDERVCVQGECVPAPSCPSDETCPATLPFRQPASCDCVACLTDSDCLSERDEFCSVDGECVTCQSRNDDPDACAEQGLRFQGGCCVACLVDADCPRELELVCEQGRCVTETQQSCAEDDDCEDDERCEGDRCVPTASLQPCSRQSDCPSDEACYDGGRCRAAGDVCGGCPAPSRCVAEPGDTRGTCAGCTASCAEAGCPDGQRCRLPEGATEGWCIDAEALAGICP